MCMGGASRALGSGRDGTNPGQRAAFLGENRCYCTFRGVRSAVERIGKLPEEQREAFDLLWYQELNQEEVARVLGVPVPTVKRRWRDAKLELIGLLGDNFPGLD